MISDRHSLIENIDLILFMAEKKKPANTLKVEVSSTSALLSYYVTGLMQHCIMLLGP